MSGPLDLFFMALCFMVLCFMALCFMAEQTIRSGTRNWVHSPKPVRMLRMGKLNMCLDGLERSALHMALGANDFLFGRPNPSLAKRSRMTPGALIVTRALQHN